MAGAVHRPLPVWPSAVILPCSGPAETMPVGMDHDCLNYLRLVGLCFLIIPWLLICLQCGRPRFNPWVRKISWRRKWQPTPVFFAWRTPMDRGSWQATVHGVAKSQTRLSKFTFTFSRITQMFVPKKAVLLDYKRTLLLLQTLRWLTGETTKVYKSWYVCVWVKKKLCFHKAVRFMSLFLLPKPSTLFCTWVLNREREFRRRE